MNKAVKIKQYLLKEEETLNGISVIRGTKIKWEASRAEGQRIITVYEEFYSSSVAADECVLKTGLKWPRLGQGLGPPKTLTSILFLN